MLKIDYKGAGGEIKIRVQKSAPGGIFGGAVASPGSELLLRAVPALLPAALRGLLATCSVRVLNRRVREEYVEAGRPFVGVVWHEDFLFVLDYFRRRGLVVMVSRSRDGELVARALHRLGYSTVRGSSSAGGREALAELKARLLEGRGSAIVADGPRGPARRAKMGCVVAARDTGVPLLTAVSAASPCVRLRNWDRTEIPLPGARIVLAFGEPIFVPRGASSEECERVRDLVDRRMAELEAGCRRALERG
jgi:lysophospholipid acyltransferase (LPLAT)-like uncharacterized protein